MAIPRFNVVQLARTARRDWLAAMDLLAATEQPLLRLGPGLPLVLVQDPAAARQVLVQDADSYGRPWLVRNIMGDALGHTMFLSEGDEWIARRSRVAPVFDRVHIDGLTEVMADAIADELDSWRPGVAADVQADLTHLTLRVACRALLGADPDDDELAGQVRDRFEMILDWLTHRFTHPVSAPAAVPTPRNRRMRAAKRELESLVLEMLERRRPEAAARFDVLSLLLTHQQANHSPSDEEIVAECVGFLFAGHETTASTLTWALYELATHADVQERVAREGTTLDLDAAALFTATEALVETGRVVDEVLRLYPAGIGIARVAKTRTELAGHQLRQHTIVLIPVYSMQRAAVWSRPNEFDPARTMPRQPAATGSPGYLPFGWGPRRCLGARVATTEARLALAMMCARWRFTYEHPEPPKAAILPSLRIDGPLRLRLAERLYA